MAMDKIRVWTRQDEVVFNEIEEKGFYQVSKESIIKKYGDCSKVYLDVYDWFSEEASKIVAKPEGAKYPIWLATETKFKIGPIKGQVLLELEVARSDIIIMDSAKWDYILNYWYIPLDEEDNSHYLKELEKQGIYNQTTMYMNDFYPVLKRQVIESWSRLFDNEHELSTITQATVWEIRKEWIVNATRV